MPVISDIELREGQAEISQALLPRTLEALERLSWNYWWTWSPDTAVFRDLDPETWEDCEHNARRLLKEVDQYRLMMRATDPVFIGRVQRLAVLFDEYIGETDRTWAHKHAAAITSDRPVAYFCAEFGIHNSLPLYSGGLGMLAGDHLKSASDLGLPLIAVGLLYHYGYFRQHLRRDGWQEENYGQINTDDLPIRLARDNSGEPLRVRLNMRGRVVQLQAWKAEVGRVSLYLLDTNLPENQPIDRLITGHLYGGDRETRCVQEVVLGVGGVRLLRQLGVTPGVFHLNEGHSAFLTLEMAREQTTVGVAFEKAAKAVRELCVFTTHTPVAAGHDEFLPSLVEKCLDSEFLDQLGISRREFFNLGRITADNDSELFGLTPLALKMCRSTNGVSRKHGEVSRALWQEIWPGRKLEKVPIGYVTNGVHAPTWVAPLIRSLYEKYIGANWFEQQCDLKCWAKGIEKISDEELWQAHSLLRARLIAFIRQRLYHARLSQGEPLDYAQAARGVFDRDALTIGFARRVAAYKRWSLILTDPDRLLSLMNDPQKPIQLVFAGKAHPQDDGAKVILQKLAQWKLDPRVTARAVFLHDYDQEIARQLVQSVDVWLNVPRRPLEASGTSGEKVAMNGGLNFSVLDGWWLEGFDGSNGWAIGDALDAETDSTPEDSEDARDAASLYRVLESEVIPAFYDRDASGIPRHWVRMMKNSIETLAPVFNSDRMVQDYVREIYLR